MTKAFQRRAASGQQVQENAFRRWESSMVFDITDFIPGQIF